MEEKKLKRHLFSVALKDQPQHKHEVVVELDADLTEKEVETQFQFWIQKNLLAHRHEIKTYKGK